MSRELGEIWRVRDDPKPYKVQSLSTVVGFKYRKHAQAVSIFIKNQMPVVEQLKKENKVVKLRKEELSLFEE